jgi:hypothetical protein
MSRAASESFEKDGRFTIGYIGNFKVDFTTENHLSRTLEGLGFRVLRFQEDEFENRKDELYHKLKNVDMLFFTRTWGRTVTLELLEKLKARGIPTVSYHLDFYVGLQRDGGIECDPFWRTDYVFTPDGDARSQKFFEERCINHIYMKPGVFEPECYIVPPTASGTPDVAFVGSYDYHGEWPYRQKLIDFLRKEYGDRFKRFGNPGRDDRNVTVVRGDALNRLYSRAKVVVGDALVLDFDHEYYWSDRVYETLGRGGFLIHPYIKGMEEEFGLEDKYLVYYEYNNFGMLKEKIDYYLTHDEEREVIRLAGNAKVKADCTYTNRMKQMFDILKEKDPRFANAEIA